MTQALDAAEDAVHATMNKDNVGACLCGVACSSPPCACAADLARVALRAALHVMPPEDVIEGAIEAASEYVSSTWRGSKAWDTKEYAIAQVAAHAAYHILRAEILGGDV